MSDHEPLRVIIVGTARRSFYMYGPLLQALPAVELVGVWGRSEDSARALGERFAVPWSTDLARLVRETAAQAGVVSVAYAANGQVGLMAVEHGLHVLLETPIAHDPAEARAIIAAAEARNLKVEVAEQFHRRPLQQLILALLGSGLFGRVYSAFNDFAGHDYHGISVMRSYLGFQARPLQVVGLVEAFELEAHWSRLTGTRGPRTERQEHALITFAGGQIGVFHWSDVAYDSALRWWRSSRFLAEKGMGLVWGVEPDVETRLTHLASGGEAPRPVVIERRYERNDGGPLLAMVAHTGDPEKPIVRWDNPFAQLGQWHDDEIGVAGCMMSLVTAIRQGTAPGYGPYQALLDQELTLAIHLSARQGGQPVSLPLKADIPLD